MDLSRLKYINIAMVVADDLRSLGAFTVAKNDDEKQNESNSGNDNGNSGGNKRQW